MTRDQKTNGTMDDDALMKTILARPGIFAETGLVSVRAQCSPEAWWSGGVRV